MPRHFGRKVADDARDRQFPMRLALPAAGSITLPASKTWRYRYPRLDQGATGTCVGHAWRHWMSCTPIGSRPEEEPTAYTIYREAIVVDEFAQNDPEVPLPDEELSFGTTVRAGAKVLAARGCIAHYLWANTMQQAVEWLLLNGPLVVGTDWGNSMMEAPNGVVRYNPAKGLAGGHAYLLRGVDTRRGQALILNSWADWGNGGEARIALEELEALVFGQNGELCAAVERRIARITAQKSGHQPGPPIVARR